MLYNAFYLLISLGIGDVGVSLVAHAEQYPQQALLVLIMIVAGGFLTIFAVGYLTGPVRPLLPCWSIVVANGLAALLAGLYLIWRRPGLRQRFNPLALIEGEAKTAWQSP